MGKKIEFQVAALGIWPRDGLEEIKKFHGQGINRLRAQTGSGTSTAKHKTVAATQQRGQV
jgi:hypothetical protein